MISETEPQVSHRASARFILPVLIFAALNMSIVSTLGGVVASLILTPGKRYASSSW